MILSSSKYSWKRAIWLSQQRRQHRQRQLHYPRHEERRKFLLFFSSSSSSWISSSSNPLSFASTSVNVDENGCDYQPQRGQQIQRRGIRSVQVHAPLSAPSTYSNNRIICQSTCSGMSSQQRRHYQYSRSGNTSKLRALRNKNKNTNNSNKEDIESSIDYRFRDSLSSSPVPSSSSSSSPPAARPPLSSMLLDDYNYDDSDEGEKKDNEESYQDDRGDDDDLVIMDVKESDKIHSLWGEAAFQAERERVQRQRQQELKHQQKQPKKEMKKNQWQNNRKSNRNENGTVESKNRHRSSLNSLDPSTFKFKPLFKEIDDIMEKGTATVKNKNSTGECNTFTASMNSLFDTMSIEKHQKSKTNISKGDGTEMTTMTTIAIDDNSSKETKKKSIFDTFPIIDKMKNNEDNANRFDRHSYEQYETMMSELVYSERYRRKRSRRFYDDEILQPVIDWLLKDERFIPYDYHILMEAIEGGIVTSPNDSEDKEDITQSDNFSGNSSTSSNMTLDKKSMRKSFRVEVSTKGSQSQQFLEQLQEQRQSFMEKSGFTNQQYDHAVRAFNILSSRCAKIGSTSSVSIAWEKMKEAGIIPASDAMTSYLYVSGMMTASGLFRMPPSLENAHLTAAAATTASNHLSSVLNILGTANNLETTRLPNKNDNETENNNPSGRIDLPTEIAVFHDLLFEPTEKSISLRVKRLVSQGNASGAEELLNSIPSISNDDAKLRTYLPVLKLYCEQRNFNSALKLFKRMRDEPSVRLEPENYVLLISALAENGYFRSDQGAKRVERAHEFGYNHTSGPKLFDELLTEMSDDILEISSASARRLYNAIAEGFQGITENKKEKERENNKLKPIHTLGGLVTDNEKARPCEVIASRVTVGTTNGICPRSGVKLQLINLESDHRRQLHRRLLQLSNSRFEKFSNFASTESDNYASKHLNSFAQWLDTREGKPFTAIIDGANVAYYMQNFEGGSFNFYQIKFMVEALEKMNENPLVVLPHKYCSRRFQIATTRGIHVVDKNEKKVLDDLMKKGQLYRVPARCLDDYYWMLASVSDQTRCRNGTDLDVSIENEEGRWPGARPMLISNDQMRDHKLGLLEPRLFRRWYSCHIVNYNFTAFVGQESVDREIGFSTADFFSREIQANDTDFGKVWHIPVSDWKLDDRFCIRIPC